MFYPLLLFMMLEGHAAVTPKSVVTILRVVFHYANILYRFAFHHIIDDTRLFCEFHITSNNRILNCESVLCR